MLNDDINIVAGLATILPTYYEQVINSSYQLPCLTYMQSNMQCRTDVKTGAAVKYYDLGYDIKLWCKSKSDINTYSQQIDAKMSSMGYTLSGGTEVLYGNIICHSMVYNAVGINY